jgi:hypothetical protein
MYEMAPSFKFLSPLTSSFDLMGWILLYLLTGIVNPTLVDFLAHHGLFQGVQRFMLLPVMCTAMGMSSVLTLEITIHYIYTRYYPLLRRRCWWSKSIPVNNNNINNNNNNAFSPYNNLSISPPQNPTTFVLAMLDLLSTSLVTLGLQVVGAATYTVIYSSAVAWTAIISSIRGKSLSRIQNLGCGLVTLGLIVNGIGHYQDDGSRSDANALAFIIACASLLLGTISHSLVMILIDEAVHDAETSLVGSSSSTSSSTTNPITLLQEQQLLQLQQHNHKLSSSISSPSSLVASRMGSHQMIFLIGWNVVLYMVGIASSPPLGALPWLSLLTMNQALHAMAFFSMIRRLGAVGSAVLKGFLALCVFGIAAWLFCDDGHAEECLSPLKVLSMIVVFMGGIIYAIGSVNTNKNQKNKSTSKSNSNSNGSSLAMNNIT